MVSINKLLPINSTSLSSILLFNNILKLKCFSNILSSDTNSFSKGDNFLVFNIFSYCILIIYVITFNNIIIFNIISSFLHHIF